MIPHTRIRFLAGRVSYSAKWVMDGATLIEEVSGKSILEPAE